MFKVNNKDKACVIINMKTQHSIEFIQMSLLLILHLDVLLALNK